MKKLTLIELKEKVLQLKKENLELKRELFSYKFIAQFIKLKNNIRKNEKYELFYKNKKVGEVNGKSNFNVHVAKYKFIKKGTENDFFPEVEMGINFNDDGSANIGDAKKTIFIKLNKEFFEIYEGGARLLRSEPLDSENAV